MIQDKIKTRAELRKICSNLKEEGKIIGFTSGAFDLLHVGHVDYLEKAKALCDFLIVGVNSDNSLKRYKGEGRPIIPQDQRVKIVAALESVDYVFLFDERRNKVNIEELHPDYYIKAGDYKKEELTSSTVVEEYGGKVRIIPITEEISTTSIIEKAAAILCTSNHYVEKDGAVHLKRFFSKESPAVFLDRDGTINEEVLYLHEPEKFKLLPNALEGIKKFQDMGYKIVIVTNQPGIGMGYFTEEDFYRVNREMLKQFSKAGILVDKIYFCPHSKAENCPCRKPNTALIQRAKEDLNLDLTHSFIVGDKTSDIETGRRAGIRTILVKTGFKGKDGEYPVKPDFTAEDLLNAAQIVLSLEQV